MFTIHKSHKPSTIYIGRGSLWGNPFPVTPSAGREQVIEQFRQVRLPELVHLPEFLAMEQEHLAGRFVRLDCHCAPLHCHGDTIAEYIRAKTNTKITRVIVAGSRSFSDFSLLTATVDGVLDGIPREQIEIVSGRAKGADRLGELYAHERGYVCRHFPAPWGVYGHRAGPIRNEWMARFAAREKGVLVAFWTGVKEHSGTYNMMQQANRFGLALKWLNIGGHQGSLV